MARAHYSSNRHTSRWTPEMDAKLTALWAQDLSGSQIAERLGIESRTAVLGRAKRINLPKRTSGDIKRKQIYAGTPRKGEPPRTYVPIRERLAAKTEAVENDKIGCQWIEGDPRLDATKCGKPRAILNGSTCSWCAHHRAIVFVPASTVRALDRREKRAFAQKGWGRG